MLDPHRVMRGALVHHVPVLTLVASALGLGVHSSKLLRVQPMAPLPRPSAALVFDHVTVTPGKLADLMLLDADPLADITNTTTVRAVVANRRYFDRAALDQLLADAHTLYARWMHEGH